MRRNHAKSIQQGARVPSCVNGTPVGGRTGLSPAALPAGGTPTRPSTKHICSSHLNRQRLLSRACVRTLFRDTRRGRTCCYSASPSQRRSRTNRGRLTTIYRSLLSYLAPGRRWRQGNYGVECVWGGGAVGVCSRKMDWWQFEKDLNASRWSWWSRETTRTKVETNTISSHWLLLQKSSSYFFFSSRNFSNDFSSWTHGVTSGNVSQNVQRSTIAVWIFLTFLTQN